MSNVKITDLPSLTGASAASTDVLPVVSVSADTTSKMTRAEFFKNVPAIDLIGAITTGSWNGATITAPYGGTGITSYAIGDLVYASTTTALSKLADVATGNALISGGIGAAPSYGKIGLTTHISGTLPVANGGTNITSYTIGDILFASASGVLSSLADVATGSVIISGGVGVAPSYGKVGLTTHVSGTLAVGNGGTGAATLTGYVKGSGTAALTASATIPNTDISGLGTMSTQAASAVAITGGTINGTTVGATTASTVAATTVTASTSVLSSGSGGIGYSTGAGVAVTQLTSRTTTTPTTGAKTTGAVTLFTAVAVVNTYFTFTVPNTAIAITDTVVVTVRGATNTYVAFVSAIVAGTSFNVTMASVAGTASDTPIVNFTIIKGVSA